MRVHKKACFNTRALWAWRETSGLEGRRFSLKKPVKGLIPTQEKIVSSFIRAFALPSGQINNFPFGHLLISISLLVTSLACLLCFIAVQCVSQALKCALLWALLLVRRRYSVVVVDPFFDTLVLVHVRPRLLLLIVSHCYTLTTHSTKTPPYSDDSKSDCPSVNILFLSGICLPSILCQQGNV